MKMSYWILSVIFFYCTVTFAQLNDFTIDVIKTDETCLGNGTLTVNTANTNPLSSLQYAVYKYPNTVVPISVLNINFLGNLNSGDYKVVVTQTLGGLFNIKEKDVSIQHVETPVTYSLASTTTGCALGGQIDVTVISGTATGFEIISGPVTRAVQPTGTFTGLPSGTYNVRVFNECGTGQVTTFTLVNTPASLSIGGPAYSTTGSVNCTTVSVSNTVTPSVGFPINYPLTVEYTINLPSGPPLVEVQNVSSGNADSLELTRNFTVLGNTQYTYTIKITDACNNTFDNQNMVFMPSLSVSAQAIAIPPCGKKFLTLNVSNFRAPYTVNFTGISFDPALYNPQHPGGFTNGTINYGSGSNPFPEGNYNITVTDACGRTGITNVSVDYDDPVPVARGVNNGCFSQFGRINVQIPNRAIVSAIILIAPAAYLPGTPNDVSSSIALGRLILTDMPLGMYKIKLVDECGAVYEVDVEVPVFVERTFGVTAGVDCTAGMGSVKITSLNGELVEMNIIGAPAAFGIVPANISTNINNQGVLFMSGLPQGNYIFKGKDECGIERTRVLTINGYQPDATPFTFLPNCGAFDIELSDVTTVPDVTYWLQELNPATGLWGHPSTGVSYTEGDIPEALNSIALTNNATKYNLIFTGQFRILKSFTSFGDGVETKNCNLVLGEFSYDMALEIRNAYTLACNGTPNDVLIQAANGLNPYTYKIVKKNGAPFLINNGNNNIFSNLQPAVYEFNVEDACGNLAPSLLNINLLPSLVDASDPDDMVKCIPDQIFTGHAFNLRSQDAVILNGQSPSQYTISYHLTQADANAGTNSLAGDFTNTVNNQEIFARVVHNLISICHEVVSFKLVVKQIPLLVMDTQYYVCENGNVTLTADSGYDSYAWSTGATTRSVVVTQPGTYTCTVANIYGSVACPTQVSVTVDPSAIATIQEVITEDWTTGENIITILANGAGNYMYSIDGIHYQTENTFTSLPIGLYTVYVKDINECGIAREEIVLLNYPKFFTPNGDSSNEKWRIKFSQYEPDLKVYIYDRYGKLITGFKAQDDGWDGTLNGKELPSTDYWFVVERKDGHIYKGHFSMLR